MVDFFLELGVRYQLSGNESVNDSNSFSRIRFVIMLAHSRMLLQPVSRYNLLMSRSAAQLLEEARKLPPGDMNWLVQNLLSEDDGRLEEERFAGWQKEVGEPEQGYEEWFRAGVQEALADTSGDVPHDEAMKHFHGAILRARKMKATA